MSEIEKNIVSKYAGLISFFLVYSYAMSFIIDILFSTSGHVLSYFTALCGFLIFIFIFLDIVPTLQIYKYELVYTFLILIIFVLFLNTKFRFPKTTANIGGVFNSFLARSVPCAFAGMLTAKKERLRYIEKYLIPIVIIVTIVLLLTVLRNPSGDVTLFVNLGIDRQTLSYIASYMICWSMYLLLNFNELLISPVLKRGFWKVVLVILCVLNVWPLFAGGGRGAVVMILVFILYFGFFKSHPLRNMKSFFILIIIIIGFNFLWKCISNLPILADGFERIVSLFTGTVDRSSQERLAIYSDSLELFWQHPFIGDGPGSALCKLGIWSHNIFIDLLADFGLIGTGVFVLLMLYCLAVTFKNIREDKNIEIAFILGMNSFIMLCFSGSYLSDGGLWFYVMYCIAYGRLKSMREVMYE